MIRLSSLLLFGIPPLFAIYLAYSIYIPTSFLPSALSTYAKKNLNLELRLQINPFLTPFYGDSDPGRVSDPRVFKRKIVAVGDLHGDFPNAQRVLQMTGVVDEKGDWTGDVDYFVQTGDIIDRWVFTFFNF
jgi:hypothetical protein